MPDDNATPNDITCEICGRVFTKMSPGILRALRDKYGPLDEVVAVCVDCEASDEVKFRLRREGYRQVDHTAPRN